MQRDVETSVNYDEFTSWTLVCAEAIWMNMDDPDFLERFAEQIQTVRIVY